MNSQVEVRVSPTLEQHRTHGVFAARCRPLGLTAYGGSAAEATESLKGLTRRFIRAHRENGTLEGVLNRSGISWRRLPG